MSDEPGRSLPWPMVAGLAALLSAIWLLAWGVLNSGAVRSAGIPHGLADLQGSWVLDRTRGELDSEPPEFIVFSAGSAADLVRLSDGTRTAEFSVGGVGRLEFGAGQTFEPLLPAGVSVVHVMTHLCPPLPAWDHLIFYPDGSPVAGDTDCRMFTYERE